MSESAQFKVYLEEQLTGICSQISNLGYEVGKKEVKIAQITMAYNNSAVINGLTKRGTLIKGEKWDKVAALNEDILVTVKENLD
jgi:hypothetical protein